MRGGYRRDPHNKGQCRQAGKLAHQSAHSGGTGEVREQRAEETPF